MISCKRLVPVLYYICSRLISIIGLTKGNPHVFWKEHEHKYPVLAAIARDILSTPASRAGVEQLFNCAHDICHYCQGQLNPETISELMLYLFASKFDLQQSELEIIKDYLSDGEAAMLEEIWKPTISLSDIDPISDDEEEEGCWNKELPDDSDIDSDNDREQWPAFPQRNTQSKQPQKKRPRNTTEPQDDDDAGLPLPEMPTEECTQGRSGRIWKKPKLPDGFEIDRL